MWVPKEVLSWFASMRSVAETNAAVSVEAIQQLREEIAAVRAERDALKIQIVTVQNNFEWLRASWNQTQAENKALLERAYGIKVPVPELTRRTEASFNLQDLFNDMGDETAREQGFPTYGDKN